MTYPPLSEEQVPVRGCFGQADELADLVRNGQKTATSFLAWRLETEGWKMPSTGDVTVVTKWDGTPSCIIETREANLTLFSDVDESFAHDYGEGDKTFSWWRKAMWHYIQTSPRITVEIGRASCRERVYVLV